MGTAASDLLAAALRDHVAALAAAEADLLSGGPDAVHDARVATRRLRAVLGEFPRLLDADTSADLRERLQSWGRLLGEARDLEVTLAMLDDDEHHVPARTRELARQQWAPRFEAARVAAVEHLATPEHARLRADLDAATAHPPFTRKAERPWQDELPRGARRATRRVEHRDLRAAALDAAAGQDDPSVATARADAHHSVRKAVRRARYALEVLARGTGPKAEHAAREVERLAARQEELGAAHDVAMLRAALADLDPTEGSARRGADQPSTG